MQVYERLGRPKKQLTMFLRTMFSPAMFLRTVFLPAASFLPVAFPRILMVVMALTVFAATSLPTRAFTPALPTSIKFQHLLENKEFSLGDVRGLLQDSQGFMWMGGSNGLIRYDGYEFKFISQTVDNTAHPEQPPELRPFQQVTAIYEDSDHNLWVVTTSHLLRYDPRTELLTAIQDDPNGIPLSNANLRGVIELHSGELLVSTWHGLFVLDRKTFRYSAILTDANQVGGLQGAVVNVTYVDRSGAIWLGTNAGLEKLDWRTQQLTLVKPYPARPDLLEANQVFDIVEDRDGSLWLGTADGLVNYHPTTGLSTRYVNNPKDSHSFSGKPIGKLMLDSAGALWIATDGGGIGVFEKTEQFPEGRFTTHQWQAEQSSSLSSNVVRAIYEDRAGDIWVGSYPSGINYFDRSSEVLTTLFDDPKARSLVQTPILAVREDANHTLWLGTDGGGLNRLDLETGHLTNYTSDPSNPHSLNGNAVLDVLVADDGKIWAGTWDGGVSVLNPASGDFQRMPFDKSRLNPENISTSKRLNNDSVWSIKEDRQKNIWLGTFRGGLSKFDQKTETYTHYEHSDADPTSISFGMVWNTFEDSKGNFWVGTLTGLDLLDRNTNQFKHFKSDPKDPNSLSNPSVTAFYEDHKHQLWIGTEAGLNLMNPDGNTFTVYKKSTGFNDDSIKTIVADEKGTLWLATNSGVSIFNPETKKVKNLIRDGSHLMGIFHIDSGLLSSRGEVILGGVEGLRIFSPNKLKDNKTAPPIVFTGLKIFTDDVIVGNPDGILTQSLNHTKTIMLDYKQNMFQLSFAALNFRDSKKNQYAYMLEGFDHGWLSVGEQRMAVYTNLDAGTYHFRVKGSNNDGIWNDVGAAITIIQLPPPWKTWWAYSFYWLSVVLFIVLFLQSQRKKRREVEEQNRLLEIKVSERTLELANNNKDLELANKKLEEVSLSDPLTDLHNRRYLYKVLPMDIARVTRSRMYKKNENEKMEADLIFYLLDIDHFKSVNDIYGHNNGDKILIQVADVLRKVCRDSDLIIRWGGEEFLIVTRYALRDKAAHIAERIRYAVAQHHYELDNQRTIRLTCSIGYASFPFNTDEPDIIDFEQAIKIADHCLYKVKRNKRNGWLGLAQKNNKELSVEQLLSNIEQHLESGVLAVETSISETLSWNSDPV